MKHKRSGFTFIEIGLFIAISGIVLISVIGMASLAISQQRYNDAAQNFAEFLRNVYSGVENPQGIGSGRSDYVIYGKLVTFGESVGLDGEDDGSVQRIFVYDVVGKDNVSDLAGGIKGLVGDLNMDAIMIKENPDDGLEVVTQAGIAERYVPRWSAVIDSTENGTLFEGSLLIVKHPRSGVINTLVAEGSDAIVQVNAALVSGHASVSFARDNSLIAEKINSDDDLFKAEEVDFCINMEGDGKKSDRRQDVRILKNAKDASGVVIVGDGENVCNEK